MGQIISKDGVSPNPKHILAMNEYVTPKNKNDVLRVLELSPVEGKKLSR